ncbi:MAG: PHP domain-containing protein [Anaerolineae bacterium]|jgi:predicted metal-dependent phosphoesterase TrpH|nr:PHP domain-containing protein [Anaerolineae bacterium]
MPSVVDLHLHTSCSDGEYLPEEVVRRAADRGLRTIAIADHDTVAGVPHAVECARMVSLRVIPAVEISCELAEGEVHLLGYFVDCGDDSSLAQMLGRFRASRAERAHAMLDKLARLGMPLTWGEVEAFAGGESVGRPHVAQALVARGYVQSVAEAFDRYLSRNGPAYVPRFKLAPEQAIALIHDSGGVAVLAHPLDVLDTVGWLTAEGLDGLEAYYSLYTPDVSAQIAAIAQRHGLIVTGGSDFHGPRVSPGIDIGSVDVPEEVVQALDERRQALHGVGP